MPATNVTCQLTGSIALFSYDHLKSMPVQDQMSDDSPSASLMNRYQSVQGRTEQWRSRKAQRLHDFNALQV